VIHALRLLFLLLALLWAGLPEAFAYATRGLENRVWKNFDLPAQTALDDALQVLEPQQEIWVLIYDPASGSTVWTKFDPLGLKTNKDYREDIKRYRSEKKDAVKAAKKEGLKGRDLAAVGNQYDQKIRGAEKAMANIERTARDIEAITRNETGSVDAEFLDDEDQSFQEFNSLTNVLRYWPGSGTAEHAMHGEYGQAAGSFAFETAISLAGAKAFQLLGKAVSPAARTIDPAAVRFSQSSIGRNFSAGGSVDDLAASLRSGTTKPGDIPEIRLVEKDGQLFSLDNRRLEAFRQAGVKVPYRMATPEEASAEVWKFTTKNGGESVRIRGQ
jgi:hypothetical protein